MWSLQNIELADLFLHIRFIQNILSIEKAYYISNQNSSNPTFVLLLMAALSILTSMYRSKDAHPGGIA